MEEPQVIGLAVSQKPPRKTRQKVGEDVLESDPDERGQKKHEFRKSPLDLGKTPCKKCPEKSKKKNKHRVYHKADPDRELAVMRRHGRNPINQDSIERDASEKSKKKGLFRCFFVQGEKKRGEGYPTQKGETELGEG